MYLKSNYSESEIIAGIQSGDNKILGMVYKSHFASIAFFILNNRGTEQEAKDIYQEAIIVLYEKLTDKNFQLSCRIKTFIYSVSRRLWLKRLYEKNRYSGKIEDFENFIQFEQKEEKTMDEADEQVAAMNLSLSELGEPCATIVKDYYIQKLSMQEISQKMGYTNADNAKNQKYKCLMRLKKLFFKRYGEKREI